MSFVLCNQALTLWRGYLNGVIVPKNVLHDLLLIACRKKNTTTVRNLQCILVSYGLDSAAVFGDQLIRLYAGNGSLLEASIGFCSVAKPTIYTWHAIISTYTSLGEGEKSIELFYEMQQDGFQPDKVTFISVLRTCAILGSLKQGKDIHEHIVRNDVRLDHEIGAALVNMYARCGEQEEALKIFQTLTVKDVGTWNVLLEGYSENHDGISALELYKQMENDNVEPDKVTYLLALKACSIRRARNDGHLMHNKIISVGLDADVAIGATLIGMYAKCYCLEEAYNVFHNSANRNVITWNVIISSYAKKGNICFAYTLFNKMGEDGHAQDVSSWNVLISACVEHGDGVSALTFFMRMQQEGVKPDKVSYLSALKACVHLGSITNGMLIHDQIIRSELKSDLTIGNTLIDVYAKCGYLNDARTVFNTLSNHTDIVSWNVMLTGYSQHEQGYPALELFNELQRKGIKFDHFTLSCLLKACDCIGAVGQARLLHMQVMENTFELDLVLGSTLVEIYGQCGHIEDAECVFYSLKKRDLAAWNAIISGYALYGLYKLVLQSLVGMKREGLKPNNKTYLSVLAAYSHSCEAGKQLQVLESLKDEHTINQGIEHFNTLVDVLGHSGNLSEAKELLHTIPCSPNVTSWLSLLSRCRLHTNKELGIQCFDNAMHLDGNAAAGYLLMANIFSDSNDWDAATRVLCLRRARVSEDDYLF